MLFKFVSFLAAVVFVSAFFTVGCSAQTEEQALQGLRQMIRDGRGPTDAYVAGIE